MEKKQRDAGFLILTGAVTLGLLAYGINSLIKLAGLPQTNPTVTLTEVSLIAAGMFLTFFLLTVISLATRPAEPKGNGK